ncbi:MAG: acyltransferase [Bacteroidales bacterium]|nr:acyltransferase [Bacteroidales bacterium]
MEPKKFEYIDSLRGIAILLVLIIHNGQHGSVLTEVAPLVDKFRFAGRYGVQLFFLVSAYTLMLSHQSRKKEEKATRNFFIRRLFRITPMYYFALMVYSIDSLFIASHFTVLENVKAITFPDTIRNIFFLNTFFPNMPYYVPGGWSVVAEISFYLLLPLMYRYINNMNKALILFIASVGISVLFSTFCMHFYNDSGALYVSIMNQFPVFILGILLFFLVNGKKLSVKPWVVVVLIAAIPLYILFVPDDNLMDCLKASLLLFLFALIICKKQYKLIVNPFFSFVGKISFSMYLIHFGVLYWMTRLNFVDFLPCSTKMMCISNYIIRYLIMFVISAGLSYLSYQYIEKFFIKQGKKFIQRLK